MVETTEAATDKLRDEIDKELQNKIVQLQKDMKKLNKVEKDVKQELTVDLVMKLCTRRTDHLQELRSEIVDSQS